jgi:hypothetical protein
MSKTSLYFALAALSLVCLEASAQPSKKIVFIAGPKDHGVPGRHEYEKGLTVLKSCLDQSTQLKSISTQLIVGQGPEVSKLGDVAAIVLYSSGDRIPKETHAIFPEDATTDHKTYDAPTMERLMQYDALMKNGVGMVVLHYATWVNNETGRKFFTDWVGGYYEDGYSKVVKDPAWSVQPAKTDHPVLNGMKPWTYEEEFFTKERLAAGAIPLLTGTSSGGVNSILSWAIERPGGGRGFVMTGVDFHKNMLNEYHRRILLNGIVWAARMPVPAGGMSCEIPESAVSQVP